MSSPYREPDGYDDQPDVSSLRERLAAFREEHDRPIAMAINTALLYVSVFTIRQCNATRVDSMSMWVLVALSMAVVSALVYRIVSAFARFLDK